MENTSGCTTPTKWSTIGQRKVERGQEAQKGRGLARAEFTDIVAGGGGVLLSGIGDRQDMTSIACLLVLKYMEFLYFNFY